MAATTWNPSDKNANVTLSNGNLTATTASSGANTVRATNVIPSALVYFEFTLNNANNFTVGVANTSAPLNTTIGLADVNGWGINPAAVQKFHNGQISYGADHSTGIIMMAVDIPNGKIWWGWNGTWYSSGDPAAGTNYAFNSLTGTLYPALTVNQSSLTANFGMTPWVYTPPTGFVGMDTPPPPPQSVITPFQSPSRAACDAAGFTYAAGI